MAARIRRPVLSLALQAAALQHAFPTSATKIRNSQLIWEQPITPTSISRTYLVQLRYRISVAPRAKILSPKLERSDGARPPHLYPGDHLCLYLPGANEWANYMFLADTIVPWISEWLLHYEIWLISGEWYGGGVHLDQSGPSGSHGRRSLFRIKKETSAAGLV